MTPQPVTDPTNAALLLHSMDDVAKLQDSITKLRDEIERMKG